jgi:SPP1 gp7 family putative phage head morphogenesis protein
MAQPSIPSSKTNPIGQTKRIKRTRTAMFKDIAAAQQLTLDAVASWPYTITNGLRANVFYDFNISSFILEQLVETIMQQLGGRSRGGQAIQEAVRQAYIEGVFRAADNLSVGGGLSKAETGPLTTALDSQQTLRKAVLAASRSFEEMEGFAGDTGRDLSRVLFEAIQGGENPRQTAKTIRERFNVSKMRAERIARTEITMAQRRGRWDEVREQEAKFGKTIKVLHNSALIPDRTRYSHAARHGSLFSVDEEALWYTINGNAINCLCSTTEIVIGPDGQPIFGQKLLTRMKTERDRFLAVARPKGRAAPVPKATPIPKAPPTPPPAPAAASGAQILASMRSSHPNLMGADQGAFRKAPTLAARALQQARDLKPMIGKPQWGAYHDNNAINMGSHRPGSKAYSNVFRHEVGHALDNNLGTATPLNRTGQFASWRAIKQLADNTKTLETRSTRPIAGARYNSKEIDVAGANAEATWERQQALFNELNNSPLSRTAFVDEKLAPWGVKGDDLARMYRYGSVEDMAPATAARMITAWERQDPYDLLHGLRQSNMNARSMVHGEHLGGLQDVFEAGTSGEHRFTFGHGVEYYAERQALSRGMGMSIKRNGRSYGAWHTGQAFANWFEAYSAPNPAARQLYKRLWPDVYDVFEEMLEEFVGAP